MRIVNKELCATYRDFPCVACGTTFGVVGHHLTSKGAMGSDIKENLIPLCVKHHHDVHLFGLNKMCKDYPAIKWFILDMGWEYDTTFKRYMRYEN